LSRPYAGIIIAGGLAAVMAFIVVMALFGPELFTKRSLTDIPDATRFDPLSFAAQAAQLAGPGLRYETMYFDGVKADGTVDLTAAYEPTGTFRFMGDAKTSDAPLGARGSDEVLRRYITLERPGWHTSRNGTKRNIRWSRGLRVYGSTTRPEPTTELPKCSLKKLWDAAIKRGIPKDAVARISHDHEGYELSINNTELPTIEFNHDCTPR
jgi:hypothetical protein